MKKFLENLKEVLEIEGRELNMSDEFRSYEEWDSLAFLSVIAMIDEEYDIQIEGRQFKELKTVEDLYKAVTNK